MNPEFWLCYTGPGHVWRCCELIRGKRGIVKDWWTVGDKSPFRMSQEVSILALYHVVGLCKNLIFVREIGRISKVRVDSHTDQQLG